MRLFTIIIRFFSFFFLGFLATENMVAQDDFQKENDSLVEVFFSETKKLRRDNPDSALVLLQDKHEEFLKRGDTVNAVKALLEMPFIYGQHVDYTKSYDTLWFALFLADKSKNDELKASVYNWLGRLYSFFKRKDQALEYLQTSLNINRKLVEKGRLQEADLVMNYYLLSATHRVLGQTEMAKVYLDSCFGHYAPVRGQLPMAYLNFEKAFQLSESNKNEEALEILEEVEPWFIENRPSYLVLVYSDMGDVYANLSNFGQGKLYYKKALEVSSKYNSHVDFSSLVHEKLATLFEENGEFEKAFENQKKAKEIDAQFFDSRTAINQSLLEIKDEFRVEKEKQERLVQKERLEKLEQADEIYMLQRIILMGSLVFLIIIGIIFFKYQKSRHLAEKQLIRKNKQLEIKKGKELLALKNKELAVTALQMVEKDEFLKEIAERLKEAEGSVDKPEIKQVLKSISHNKNDNWEEFRLRFTAVNQDFYTKITTLYPKLSQADQKICALIKLNFSSKEMARLLGISVESVHTTRYRLRKKMKLNRSVNLEEYISSI
ncbi:tetratricopeptide repeat protein [Zobellia sp. B3R18]|uniref:tetratricopeptide repeat protein n=1 Tax=Zobellia sp. B3R18 TaxID=2841568 RepID=UPI001C065100|nr:tetratricopeptide repeat protein [Zobellia sp. B3R18]MBU2976152.1 tetratricopeptide repeat protein [Zobellia sp. B3R18]